MKKNGTQIVLESALLGEEIGILGTKISLGKKNEKETPVGPKWHILGEEILKPPRLPLFKLGENGWFDILVHKVPAKN